jgi:tripartite ATP-independent transporter DctM subunit
LTLPELERQGYDRSLSMGSLAASGSLGMLIPPSIVMIVYGVAAEVSIARLFLAGILPGLLLIGLFMSYVAIRAWLKPSMVPPTVEQYRFWERVNATRHLAPVVLLIIGVIGSIYAGIATPTEAAAVGVLGALLISAFSRSLTWQNFMQALLAATYTSCMIGFIMATAAFLSVAMGFTGLPRLLGEWITAQGLSAYSLLVILTIFFIILGCFLDGISMVVLTSAVILPAVQAVGIDLLWFGIYVVLVVEMSQVTPPVGFNLFVVQAITGDNILKVAAASMPFFLLMILEVAILAAFPDIVSVLPNMLTRN